MENQTRVELIIEFESMEEMKEIFGILDENIRLIEKGTGAEIAAKDGKAVISGTLEQAEMAKQVIEKLCEQFRQQEYIDENKVSYFLDLANDGVVGTAAYPESWEDFCGLLSEALGKDFK